MTRDEAVAECEVIRELIERGDPDAVKRAANLDVAMQGEEWWTYYISEKAGALAGECAYLFAPRKWQQLGATREDARASVLGECAKLTWAISHYYANAWADQGFDDELVKRV